MENLDYNKFYYAIGRYGTHPRIEVKSETHDFYGYASTAISQVMGRQTVTMSTDFFDKRMFDEFVKDILSIEELREEAYHRSRNPTLQRAYEEYQLLLKLSK